MHFDQFVVFPLISFKKPSRSSVVQWS